MIENKSSDNEVSNNFLSEFGFRHAIFIEKLKFIDDEFWISFRFGRCLRMFTEKIIDVANEHHASAFTLDHHARLQTYLTYQRIYQNFIKHQCPEIKEQFISEVLEEANL